MINPYEAPANIRGIPSENVLVKVGLLIVRMAALALLGYVLFVIIVRLIVTDSTHLLESGGGLVTGSVFASSEFAKTSRLRTFDFLRRLIVSGCCMITIVVLGGFGQSVLGFAPRRFDDSWYFPSCVVLVAVQLGAMLLLRAVFELVLNCRASQSGQE